MKKLYFLDDQERNRIIQLHESFTKKQYLKEQTTTNQNIGVWTSEAKNAWDGLMRQFDSYTFRDYWNKQVRSFCSTNYERNFPDGPTFSVSTIQGIVNSIGEAMKAGSISTFGVTGGRGVDNNTTEQFKTLILKLKNVANFCYAVQNLKPAGARKKEDIMQIFNEIYSNKVYKDKILVQLRDVLPKNMKVDDSKSEGGTEGANLEGGATGEWGTCKFMRLTQYQYVEDYDAYADAAGTMYFFRDGTYLDTQKDPDADYSGTYRCNRMNKIKLKPGGIEGGGIVDTGGEEKKKIEKGSGTGTGAGGFVAPYYGYATSSVRGELPALFQSLGIQGTTINQDTVNQLYDKISKLK